METDGAVASLKGGNTAETDASAMRPASSLSTGTITTSVGGIHAGVEFFSLLLLSATIGIVL